MIKRLVESLNNENLTIYKDDVPSFELPIYYIDKKNIIEQNIIDDLELQTSENNTSIYENLFYTNKDYRSQNSIINKWSEYYTNDINFLKDMQNLVNQYETDNSSIEELNKVDDILKDVKSDTGFLERYNYIDTENFTELNDLPLVLQILTLHNLAGPVLSLIIPIIMCIIPFFLIKLKGLELSFENYLKFLLETFKHHALGKSLNDFNQGTLNQKMFVILSFVFYGWNMYQNVLTCKQFHKNIYKVKDYLLTISNFLKQSINKINNINGYCGQSMYNFVNTNNKIKNIINYFNNSIEKINLNNINITTIGKIGEIFHCFYKLYKIDTLQKSIRYCIHLNCFSDHIGCIKENLENKNLNLCKFSKKNNTSFKDAFYIALINKENVKNSYTLDKKLLITGPNAAGKTTLLKTTIINILLSQNLGLGCYRNCHLNPYKFIYSYINIPDTSDRDSLFQAEARRCKEILDNFENFKKERHFCIFDEIYSGTNPVEAIASAYSFIKYISKNKNIDLLLTTHYIKLCKLFINDENILNNQMIVSENKPKYKLGENISNVKGGIRVLEELKYNRDIISLAREILEKINE